MFKDLLAYLVALYKNQLAPYFQDAIISTFEFFRLVGSDPIAAAPHGAAALATTVSLSIIIYYLLKVIVNLNKLFEIVGQLFSWLKKLIINTADYCETIITEAFKNFFSAMFKGSTYSKFIAWCAMIDTELEQKIAATYKDGATHIRYQKNLGLAVITVTLWSSFAFAFAVLSAGNSFTKSHSLITIAAIIGSILYGLLILTLDRSIIAPFSPSSFDEKNPSISEISHSFFKLLARIVVAIYVARFTALPLTMLILHGGIVDFQMDKIKAEKQIIEFQIAKVESERSAFALSKRNSAQCVIANQAVQESQRRIDDMARAGCKNGQPTCPKKGTEYFEKSHPKYVEQQTKSCEVNSTELRQYTQTIDRYKVALKNITKQADPDVLQGAIILETIAVQHEKNKHFHPVTATFYLLFIIELFPVLIKLWRNPWILRRRTHLDDVAV